MREIRLTQGKVAIVDDSDFDELSKFKWIAARNGRHWCACRTSKKVNGKRFTIYMHRQIMGFPDGMEVDHRDRNGLHNWRSNLRLASDLQQAVNKTSSNAIGFRGVRRRWTKFEARINDNKVGVFLGSFRTAYAAARAYDRAAIQLHGEFAVLNFPKR